MSLHSDIALAERQIRLGNPRAAIEALRRALKEYPDHALAHAYLAMCLQDTGQPAAARSAIAAALSAAPESGFVRYAAGSVALRQRRYDDAAHQLSTARQLMPAHGETCRLLAQLHGRRGRLSEVLPLLLEGLRHEPENVWLICDIGTHHLNTGRTAEAEQSALRALTLAPEAAPAHVLMGHVRLQQNRDRDALECALAALTCQASYWPALRLLAAIEFHVHPLTGIWWRIGSWLGRQRDDDRAMAHLHIGLTLTFVAVLVLLNAGLTWLAIGIILGLGLAACALLLTKLLFQRRVRSLLREFRFHRYF